MEKNIIIFILALMSVTTLLTTVSQVHSVGVFNDSAFEQTWNKIDKPVQEIPAIGRGYTWGPVVQGSESTSSESYNGGIRKIQYFDKARMEINNPGGNRNELFYVTTGLLVKELVTGLRQDGDNTFIQTTPSSVQVAGDPNDNGANSIAPTYASFAQVVTFNGNENGKDSTPGNPITNSLNKAGAVSTITPVERRTIGGYDTVTRHNIADVFVSYGNTTGQIWNGKSYEQGNIFFGNSVYVLGRPVTEPYWVQAVVAGTEKAVLVQLFERRVLTYTPSNPDGFKVEMGNVGQHYFRWRYGMGTPSTTPITLPTGNVLGVNYTVMKNTFTNQMLGVNFVNWEHGWGKPYANDVPGLAQALKAAHVGLFRYAGGNWSNSVGWDRNESRDPYTGWPNPDNGPYWFQYNRDEIDSVAKLAQTVGADVMIEVNISNDDPAMWADMVKYTNIEHKYGFKYWELGNELDADKQAPDPAEYNKRLGKYLEAMLAADPTIKIVISGVASPYEATRQNYSDSLTLLSDYLTKPFAVTSPTGRKAQALSYHWYQACNSDDPADLQRYSWDGLDSNSWRNSYSRKEADIMPPRIIKEITKGSIPQGVTEFNFDACNYDNPMNGNFLNALWNTDVLGRMAYNGTNFATRWEGYGTQGYSFVYPDDGNSPSRIMIRPAYYAYLMYANYFGDQMVESSSFDNTRISIWAAKDSSDPTKLKLMVTNLSGSDITVPVSIPGFNANSASLYQLRSANPTDISEASLTASVTINGVSVDGMNVADSLTHINPIRLTVSGASFNYTFPAYTTTAIVLTGS